MVIKPRVRGFICVTTRLLFDHALDHAGGEGYPGCLDHLEVGRRQQGRQFVVGMSASVGQ